MTYEQILEALRALNPEALLLEPRKMFDPCLVGMTNTPTDDWPRVTDTWVAIYDADKCVRAMIDEIIHEDDSMDEGEVWQIAVDNFDYNVSGGWMGEHTPTFIHSGWVEE